MASLIVSKAAWQELKITLSSPLEHKSLFQYYTLTWGFRPILSPYAATHLTPTRSILSGGQVITTCSDVPCGHQGKRDNTCTNIPPIFLSRRLVRYLLLDQ